MSGEESVTIIQEYFDFMLPLVLEAGKVLLDSKNIKSETKNETDWDLVTNYDTKLEEFFFTKINTAYPNHKFIGEEGWSETEKITLTDDPTWIIDPIDGTENFVRNLRLSCISVGLTVNKEQALGIVYNPYMDELFTAMKGQGAFLNGKKIRPTDLRDYKKSFFNYELGMARTGTYLYNLYMFRLKHLIPKVMTFRCLGCVVLGLCYVACGKLDAYQCDGLYPWDAAAGTLIVKEAGGYVIDSSGKEFNLMEPNFLATSTKELADQYLKIEREADEEMNNVLKENKVFLP